MKTYTLTQDQLDDLEHFKHMFEHNAELLRGICSSEKDDIVYGFELGRMYSSLESNFLEMSKLMYSIKEQPKT